MKKHPSIVIFGLWHQGLVAAACLAESGAKVVCLSRLASEIQALAALDLPVEEPGLREALALQMQKKNLTFSTDIAKHVSEGDFIFLMHDLPVNHKDESSDKILFSDVNAMLPYLNRRAVVTVTAQCVVGTSQKIKTLLESRHHTNPVCYIPENLRLGSAIARFKAPDLPVIGTQTDAAFQQLQSLLAPFSGNWKRTGLNTAEMLKHSLNAYLALTIGFANEIGNICEQVGADGHAIADFLKLEPRIGKKAMLRPGLGYSGGTLARDIQALGSIAQSHRINVPLLQGVAQSNRMQNKRIFHKIKKLCAGCSNPVVCVLGLTYKPGTSATRRSSSIEIIKLLQKSGHKVKAYDPGVAMKDPNLKAIRVMDSAEAALKDADMVVLMTPWESFAQLSPAKIKKLMRGTIVFDPNSYWDKNNFTDHKMAYTGFGHS